MPVDGDAIGVVGTADGEAIATVVTEGVISGAYVGVGDWMMTISVFFESEKLKLLVMYI